MKRIMISTIGELWNYIKQPKLILETQPINTSSLQAVLTLFLVAYGLSTICLFTINNYIRANYEVSRSEIVNTEEQGLWMLFLVVVIVYPVVEEFVFRYYLKNKKVLTLIFISLTVALTGYWLAKQFSYSSSWLQGIIFATSIMGPVLLLVATYVQLRQKDRLHETYRKYFFIPFYISVVAFASLHASNFTVVGHPFLQLPLLIPFVISGLILGFARMRYGMWANILLHVSFNFTSLMLDQVLKV